MNEKGGSGGRKHRKCSTEERSIPFPFAKKERKWPNLNGCIKGMFPVYYKKKCAKKEFIKDTSLLAFMF